MHEPAGGQRAGEIPGEPPDFVPRADLLAELDRPDARVLVLQSVSGAGATQVAAAYARARLAHRTPSLDSHIESKQDLLRGILRSITDQLWAAFEAAVEARTLRLRAISAAPRRPTRSGTPATAARRSSSTATSASTRPVLPSTGRCGGGADHARIWANNLEGAGACKGARSCLS